ncbi:MAG TPA: SET domain-containing protein [Chloroflexota bacterium]|nr:SET domain-containing protein [Chloroflexota bacterium]
MYIDDQTFRGARVGEYDRERVDRGDFINHSCDPNVWLADENTLVARHAITAGEELTSFCALDGRWPWLL